MNAKLVSCPDVAANLNRRLQFEQVAARRNVLPNAGDVGRPSRLREFDCVNQRMSFSYSHPKILIVVSLGRLDSPENVCRNLVGALNSVVSVAAQFY